MALEDDNTSDLRRKAMRNGEEDPFTVAQRYLNIYRQIHIFSPERKASFDKMVLELSPEIRGIFSLLPGGAMLQDYVDELAEKNGLSVSRTPNLSYEEYTPATEIPVQAAPVNPTPVQAAPVQAAPVVQTIIPQMGPAKISFDKDFANEFARIIGDVMQKQSVMQKNNLEALVQNLSKTQMFIAKNIKESRDIQKSEIATLCKILIQSHKALSASFATMQQRQTKLAAENEITTKKLMSIVLDNQKQINLRLDKAERLPTNTSNTSSLSNIGGAELLAAIEQSQANLVKSIMGANLQQNNTNNNQANNIQINTPDTSAQTLLLLDKMMSMQQQNENNLANALTKAIEAQGELFEKISRRQENTFSNWVGEKLKFSRKKQSEYNEDEADDFDVSDFDEEEIFFEAPKKKNKPKQQNQNNKNAKLPEDKKNEDINEIKQEVETPAAEVEEANKTSLTAQEQDIINTTAFVDDTVKETPKVEAPQEEPDFDWDSLIKEADNGFNTEIEDNKTSSEIDVSSGNDDISSSDWGFSENIDDEILIDNDNFEGEDWEWAYEEEGFADDEIQGEAIGDNSFIYAGDLYSQSKVVGDSSIVYTPYPIEVSRNIQILDTKEREFNDPYKK